MLRSSGRINALILQLLDTLVQTADRRETDYATVKHELQGHMHVEEATLYRRMERSMHKRIAASIEEHNSFRKNFGRLDRTHPERRRGSPV
ncbi:hemerythrin domain-containing protein [Methanoculleus taiwanensis]|uniref:hemerythrin domain-containing protein n=1 Tax=Methanoculleus taiwanensis TaxID=1550565 RepID=UPI000FFEFAF6|nr:hemerythrin domain-containing protein [Methanoculleus taiwanensis]